MMQSVAFALLSTSALAQQRSAGVLYEVWHTKAAQLMQQVTAMGGVQLNTEQVIRSKGNLTLDDVYARYNLSGDIWNVQPALGYYCLYLHRPGEPNPPVPDCVNVTQTATAHAQLLLSAGFDYVSVDITNWPANDTNGPTDIAVLRPTEVLFEQWAALRAAGTPTPAIALWPCSPAGSTTWQWLLDNIYNQPAYQDLVWKDAATGKKVMFIPYNPTCYDPATAALIASNGGRNDVAIVPMWALFGAPFYGQGVWGFFSPCTDSSGAYTTSMVGVGPCNQFPTYANGTNNLMEISASSSYMVSQTALPFASPGHLRGLTLARLFEQVLAAQPANVFLSSFNEMIGGRQAPASGAKIAFNMGLPADPQKDAVWVDSYASEFSRDMEPTVEGGDYVFRVVSACLALYKAGQTCADVSSNLCCSRDDKEIWSNIWSLKRTDGGDYLLTNNPAERQVLVASGQWVECCNAIPNPTSFCVDTSIADGRDGPFMLYNTSTALPPPSGNFAGVTVPVYRCITPGGIHFFSGDASGACEGLGKAEFLLGYAASTPGGETLRALHRCTGPVAGTRVHALDLPCDNPDGTTAVLGYVR